MTLDEFIDLLTNYCNCDIADRQISSIDNYGIFYNKQQMSEFLEGLDKIKFNLEMLKKC